MTNTKDLKDVIKLIAHLGNGIGKSFSDGKGQFSDLINFIQVVQDAPAAIVGIQNVPAEIAKLDAEDKADLEAFFRNEFDIPQDLIEAAVENGIELALHIIDFAITTFSRKK